MTDRVDHLLARRHRDPVRHARKVSSNVACSPPSASRRKRSTASSRRTTATPSHSSGKSIPRPSSSPPKEGIKVLDSIQ
jgi:hypothetical protein